jgi:ent-copalyl diphosphate/ent-kaurene synthase
VFITVFQACLRTLIEQQDNGSWNSWVEETAYGILILAEARRLPIFVELLLPLESAIERGAAYIQSFPVFTPIPLWIEKVSHSSTLPTDTYILAALKKATLSRTNDVVGASIFDGAQSMAVRKQAQLLKQIPLFSKIPIGK